MSKAIGWVLAWGVLLAAGVALLGEGSAGQSAVAGPAPQMQAMPRIHRFAVLGSTGEANMGQFQVAAALQGIIATRGCDDVILLGDNIFPSGVSSTADPQWQSKFEVPYAAIDQPFWAILGNHDYGGNGAGFEFFKGPVQVAYTQVSSKWHMPATYYQRTAGPVHFVALDTNVMLFNQTAQQTTDVTAWLAASEAPWTIVLGHHNYLSNGEHGNAGNYDGVPTSGHQVKTFLENVIAGQADIYFSGGDYNLQWLTPSLGGTQLIMSAAGAKTTTLPGGHPAEFQAAQLGFIYCVAEPKRLTLEFIGTAGQTLYADVIVKP